MTKRDAYRPSMAERSVGRAVRRWRDERGLSLAEAGRLLGFSSAKLSMIENALRPIDQAEAIALGIAYRVMPDAWQRAAACANDGSVLDAAEDFEDVHTEVTAVRAYGENVITRLLQSHGYMARVDSDIDPIEVEIVVAEAAVRRTSRLALLNVVDLVERKRLDVRISNEAGDERPSTGTLLHLTFPHKRHDDVVFVERSRSSSYIEDTVACQLIRQSFETVQRAALGTQESINLIAELADGGQE